MTLPARSCDVLGVNSAHVSVADPDLCYHGVPERALFDTGGVCPDAVEIYLSVSKIRFLNLADGSEPRAVSLLQRSTSWVE